VVLRALVLLELSSGQSAPGVARNLELTPKAVRDIGWRYREGGLERHCTSGSDRARRLC
jgi:hypothetical protein